MTSDIRLRHPAQPNGCMVDTISAAEGAALLKKTEDKLLIAWDDLPDWSKDNEYIHTGFRPISNSYWKCFQSCFYAHNETGNIYTHLLATLWMIALPTALYPYARDHYPTASADDWTVFALFFLGGISCFALSTTYHVLANHSHAVHDFAHQLDYLGIIVVTAGCFPPGVWYTFPCAARKIKVFWIALDLVAQFLAAIFVVFVRRFRQPAWRPLRGFLFSFMASSAFYPIIYACFLHGYRQMDDEAAALRYALTVMIYLAAVTIYAIRMPEAWRPGWFDIWGQSHQIFHVLMAVGLTAHFWAFVKAFDYTHRAKQCLT